MLLFASNLFFLGSTSFDVVSFSICWLELPEECYSSSDETFCSADFLEAEAESDFFEAEADFLFSAGEDFGAYKHRLPSACSLG